MYKGTFLNGKEFDSNMDKNKPGGNQPLTVLVGAQGGAQGSVIPGLDEGIRMFGKGGKGKVYIPAMLGYGQNGQPPVIPPYASMIFEIEVLDVTTPAPPAPVAAQPGMPGGQPQASPHGKK